MLHPYTHENAADEKTQTGERLDSDGAFSSDGQVLWDLPIIDSKVIPENVALVGDFTLACTLLIREGVNLRMSDSDQDDFIRNRVTLLAEGRVALAGVAAVGAGRGRAGASRPVVPLVACKTPGCTTRIDVTVAERTGGLCRDCVTLGGRMPNDRRRMLRSRQLNAEGSTPPAGHRRPSR